jgi:hypothetical protein
LRFTVSNAEHKIVTLRTMKQEDEEMVEEGGEIKEDKEGELGGDGK